MEFERWWAKHKPIGGDYLLLEVAIGVTAPVRDFALKVWEAAQDEYRDGLDWKE